MKKVISKGYTLTVTSWENNDNKYKDIIKNVNTEKEAIELGKMCKELFNDSRNNENCIGNIINRSDKTNKIIIDYLKNNPNIFEKQSELSEEELINVVMYLNHSLLGKSINYYSRACKDFIITYSPEDIFLEEIKF